MPRVAIGSRLRHLFALSRCPAAQSADRFAERWRSRRRSSAIAASASPATARSPRTRIRGTRASARAGGSSAPARAACKPALGRGDDFVQRDLVDARRAAQALPLVMAHADARRARSRHRSDPTGHCAPATSVHTGPTSGVPIAAAMCSGPVSPDTTSAASRISTARSDNRRRRRRRSRRRRTRVTTARRARARMVPRSPAIAARCDRCSAAASAPNRSGGQRLFGHAAPGLSTMNPREPPAAAIAAVVSADACGVQRQLDRGPARCRSADRIERFF